MGRRTSWRFSIRGREPDHYPPRANPQNQITKYLWLRSNDENGMRYCNLYRLGWFRGPAFTWFKLAAKMKCRRSLRTLNAFKKAAPHSASLWDDSVAVKVFF